MKNFHSKEFKPYTIKLWMSDNFIFRGFILMIEQILWYLHPLSLYDVFQVNKDGTELIERKVELSEFEDIFSQYRSAFLLNPPSFHVILPSTKKFLYKLDDDDGIILIKMGKAFRGYFSSLNGNLYWIDKYKCEKQNLRMEQLKKKALINYNRLLND